MHSQLNNQSDNQEVFQGDKFRPVFFDKSGNGGGNAAAAGENKRVRIESDVQKEEKLSPATKLSHDTINALTQSGGGRGNHPHVLGHKKRKAPKFVRKFRSRSLPIINYSKGTHIGHVSALNLTSIPPLPPINLHSLKEIDLHEILKNPQLRHDILFDPQLQFRPNLDGERGKRKKSIIDKYWSEIEKESSQFFQYPKPASNYNIKISRLPILFTTLRDILLSLLPYKERSTVNDIMDIDLLIQQLSHGSLDFVSLSQWLGEVFKSHCAPMRDQWVVDMMQQFKLAYEENSVERLVQGLRMIFLILEAMKLDVANHQIRILRPVLVETAVDFEKDYFNQLIVNNKIEISDSLKWFYKLFYKNSKKLEKHLNGTDVFLDENLKVSLVSSIIDLFSCRNMATEFPSTLAFDHTRLILLRADVRQLVCVQLSIALYKQLLINFPKAASYITESTKPSNLKKVQDEILAIVRDENGSVKWTRNVQVIALQLVKNTVTNPITGITDELPNSMIEFANRWLVKQIQPSSDVYGLMEERVFNDLLSEVIVSLRDSNTNINSISSDTSITNSPRSFGSTTNFSELSSIAKRIATLAKFHWSVFGSYYYEHLKSNQ